MHTKVCCLIFLSSKCSLQNVEVQSAVQKMLRLKGCFGDCLGLSDAIQYFLKSPGERVRSTRAISCNHKWVTCGTMTSLQRSLPYLHSSPTYIEPKGGDGGWGLGQGV